MENETLTWMFTAAATPRINLDECEITLSSSSKNGIDAAIQAVKLIGFALHIIFFLVVAFVREFHTRSSMYLINLGVVSFVNLVDGVVSFDPDFMCLTGSAVYCVYQSMFIQYYSYLYSYAVVLLAFYRLICSSSTRLCRTVKASKMILLLLVSWTLPFVLVIISKFALNGPVVYNDLLDACRISYKRRRGGFVFFLCFGFVVPTLMVAGIYVCILIRVKNIKKKVMSVNIKCREQKVSSVMQISGGNNNHNNKNNNNNHNCHEDERRSVVGDSGEDVIRTATAKLDDMIQMANDCGCDDENSIRRQNSRKPLTEQSPSSVPASFPTVPGSSETRKKQQSSGGGGEGGGGAGGEGDHRVGNKIRRGLVYSRMKLFSTEFKLIVQFLVIFLSYFIYSISNILLTYQLTVTTDNRWDKDVLKVFRLMIWTYHLLNPVIFLSFHPIFLNKFVKSADGPCKIHLIVSFLCFRCL